MDLGENSFVATGQRVATPDLTRRMCDPGAELWGLTCTFSTPEREMFTHALVVEVGGDRFAVGGAGPNGRGPGGDQAGRTSDL